MKKSIFLIAAALLACSCKLSVKTELVEEEKLQPEAVKKLTVMVYMPADNNLSSAAIEDLNEMEDAEFDNEKINVICFADISRYLKSNADGANIFRIVHDDNEDNTSIVSKRLSCSEMSISSSLVNDVDSSNPENITEFIKFAKNYFPAENYAFIIWGHGSGWRNNSLSDFRAVSFDDSEGKYISLPEFHEALKQGMGEEKLSLVGFDTCFGNEMEVAYELKDCCKWLCGTEGLETSDGWNYKDFLEYIDTASEDVGLNAGTAACSQFESEYSIINLEKMEALFKSFEEFMSDAVLQLKSSENIDEVKTEIRSSVINYYVSDTVSDLYVNVFQLVKLLVYKFPDLTETARTYYDALKETVITQNDDEYPLGIYFCSVNKDGSFAKGYSDYYIHNEITEGKSCFVNESEAYVPAFSGNSFLDVLFNLKIQEESDE